MGRSRSAAGDLLLCVSTVPKFTVHIQFVVYVSLLQFHRIVRAPISRTITPTFERNVVAEFIDVRTHKARIVAKEEVGAIRTLSLLQKNVSLFRDD